MKDVRIQGTSAEGDNLYVTGTVDGIAVKAHGWVSRFNQLPNDQRKIAYLEELISKASPISPSDQILIQKYLRVGFHKRAKQWLIKKAEHAAVSSVVFIIGLILRHYFLLYLPQIEHLLHMNLHFLK